MKVLEKEQVHILRNYLTKQEYDFLKTPIKLRLCVFLFLAQDEYSKSQNFRIFSSSF